MQKKREYIFRLRGNEVKGPIGEIRRNVIGIDENYPSLSELSEEIEIYNSENGENLTDTIHPVDRIATYIILTEKARDEEIKLIDKIFNKNKRWVYG